jgi:hypothetical protein
MADLTAPGATHTAAPERPGSTLCLALVLMCEDGSLDRTGRRILIREGETVTIGRHKPGSPVALGHFVEHRPGLPMLPPSAAGGLRGDSISHEQLLVTATKDGLYVKVIGKRATQVNGRPFKEGLVQPTGRIMLVAETVLFCMWVPIELPMPRGYDHLHPFGEPDHANLLGESYIVWQRRGHAPREW